MYWSREYKAMDVYAMSSVRLDVFRRTRSSLEIVVASMFPMKTDVHPYTSCRTNVCWCEDTFSGKYWVWHAMTCYDITWYDVIFYDEVEYTNISCYRNYSFFGDAWTLLEAIGKPTKHVKQRPRAIESQQRPAETAGRSVDNGLGSFCTYKAVSDLGRPLQACHLTNTSCTSTFESSYGSAGLFLAL